ncbi:UNVERIFIED_CONTAM: purine permease [Acinetobacter baumannii]|uniref:nucleobase:cation symporter-2 family protein n=1 Tax=Acinetobacter TaxID=469 RepID=UPI00028808BD|nr:MULTISPECIES: nucleobase:cation symporter-2 family protein [Acinetobacter]EHU1483184.1 purine permease [Acinetobacter baumannii]EHU2604376.1 purine permease [Acinetobacter baumannii]EHU2703379.1 purine permease [Acinetobacter baumannii]EHU3426241.1 purine permease [Acinetobacter baumannii]EIB6891026.1 purine permease [Acinetobacter baumannii]
MNHQQKNAISPEHEYLGISKSFAYGLQHVLTMYGGIVAPPLIIGTAAGLSAAQVGMLIAAALFVGGLATLIQTIGTKYLGAKLPLVQGVSFAGVATMVAIITTGGGLPAVYGAVIAASLIGLCLAPYFSKIIRFFPPVVTGCVITIIGLSLLPVAIRWMMGGNNKAPDWGSVENISLALLTLGIVIILNILPQASIRRLSILLAIVAGTILAYFMGFGDFSQVSSGAWLQFPHLFAFGLPTFELSAILSMLIVTLVIMTETTADIIAVGDIVGTEVDSKRIANGVRADMFSSAIAPIFGSFMQSAFAQNVGLVAITGIKSRFVVAAGGVILIILGLLPVMGRLIAAIPMPVLGGAGLVLFGSVAASGIRTLAKIDYNDQKNLIIVATALSAGMIPIINHEFYAHFPVWVQTLFHSGISSTCIFAILLNLLFNHLPSFRSSRTPHLSQTINTRNTH